MKYHFVRGLDVLGSVDFQSDTLSDQDSAFLESLAEVSDALIVPDNLLAETLEIIGKAAEAEKKEAESKKSSSRSNYYPRRSWRNRDFDDDFGD